MSQFFHHLSRAVAAIAFAMATVAHAAPFVAPAEENPPFRRDLLPVDTDSMVTLSEDLALLSHGIPLKSAAARRAAAQSLALALALDPANSSARDTISALEAEKIPAKAKPARLTTAKARLWQIHAWLAAPEAGTDGQLLADLIGDTASVLDPSNPTAVALRESPEKGRWDDWVAPLSAFEEEALAKNGTDPFEDIEPDMPAPGQTPAAGKPAILLNSAALTTVLHVFDKESGAWFLRPATVEMTASNEGTGAFSVSVETPPSAINDIEQTVSLPIRTAVEAYNSGVPDDGLVSMTIGGGGTYSFSKNGTNITGPGFILANSAITGVAPEATVIATLGEEGALTPPPFFWRLLTALSEGKGGRLVVPAEAEGYFTALLTLENPEFFLKYEVLIASTPKEFMELCASEPSENLAAAHASFKEIKDKAEGTALGAYLANRFVRQRLQDIVDTAPYHLSAKILAMQGAGERPRSLGKKVLASEIWRAIAPISDLVAMDFRLVEVDSIDSIEKTYETMRLEVDQLERYTDIRDRDLLTEGKDATTTVRTLARAMRSRSDDLLERFESITAAHQAMVEANRVLVEKLALLSGDPDPNDTRPTRGIRKRDLRRNN